jgi:hypothetical protein
VNPDVGGDSSTFILSTFCVVYEYVKPGGDSDILYRLVTGNGNVIGTTPWPFSAVLPRDGQPSISKSNDGRQWMVVFKRKGAGSDQVFAGRIDVGGTIRGYPYAIMNVTQNLSWPRVSSPLNGTLRYLVTAVSNGDVILVTMDGYVKLNEVNLSVLEAGGGTNPAVQSEPTVDCDGARFFVAYTEGLDLARNVLGSALRLNASNGIVLLEPRVLLGGGSFADFRPCVASKESAGGPIRRFLVSWTSKPLGASVILASIYDRP